MSQTVKRPVFVPRMHAAFVPEALIPHLDFLDPGCGPATGFLPPGLPLDARESRQYLRDMTAWGNEFKKPSDVLAMAVQQEGERKVQTENLRRELSELDRLAGKDAGTTGRAGEERTGTDLKSSQMVLILAWSLEEAILEAAGAKTRLDTGWERFSQSLGLEEGEELPGAHLDGARPMDDLTPRELAAQGPPWTFTMEHLLRLIPQDALLAAVEQDLRLAWEEAGIGLEDMDPARFEEVFPGVPAREFMPRIATAPGWQLLGRTAPVPGKEWLDTERRVIFLHSS